MMTVYYRVVTHLCLLSSARANVFAFSSAGYCMCVVSSGERRLWFNLRNKRTPSCGSPASTCASVSSFIPCCVASANHLIAPHHPACVRDEYYFNAVLCACAILVDSWQLFFTYSVHMLSLSPPSIV